MPCHDRYGLVLSTSSQSAAAAYRAGIDLILSAWPGAAEAFDMAIAADPGFALAHAARARVHSLYAEGEAAKAKAAVARELVNRNGTVREQSHVNALAHAVEGQPSRSLTCALSHLENWPRDALILSLLLGAYGLLAFSGRADHNQARLDLCEGLAHHYGDDWWFLTYLGWAHTENGSVGTGRGITQRAINKRRENGNAAHALSHAMFEDGSIADAEAFLADWLPVYDRSGLLHGHMSWHQALLALEQGDAARALAIYVDRIQPKVTTAAPLFAVVDGASLLWRLTVYGYMVPKEIWEDAAAYAERIFPKSGIPFADVHVALGAAATGNLAGLEQRIGDLERRLEEGTLPQGNAVPAICRGARAFADADYAGCVRILEPVANEMVRIGGSHAQREVIEDTLLIAMMKSDQPGKARELLDRRLHRRPSPRDMRWRTNVSA
jgi:Tfp pilus assembly protein PilF